jgi:hypothetical protein
LQFDQSFISRFGCWTRALNLVMMWQGNTKWGSITVLLTSCLTGLD